MGVLLTAVAVLVGLIGSSVALVGLAEVAGRSHQRERARKLVDSLEEMLLLAVKVRGR